MNGAATPSPTLTDVQLAALGGAVKDTALTVVKHRLPDGHKEAVDFRVRIHGFVSKGNSTAPSTGTMPATCELFNRNVISQVLRRLKVEPKRLRALLRSIAANHAEISRLGEQPANAELLTVFNEIGAEVAKTLPPVPTSSPGRAGAVSSNVSYELLA